MADLKAGWRAGLRVDHLAGYSVESWAVLKERRLA